MRPPLDLNLLKVLVLIHKHRHLKPVAKELGKTESAVSKHLAKLREQLDDPLFVRGVHEFEPTEYTVALLPKVTAGLRVIEDAIVGDTFDPLTYDKEISVAIPNLAQYLVGKSLLVDLIKTFPNAKITLTSWSDTSVEQIMDNQLDIGVQYFNPEMSKAIYQHQLGRYKGGIVTTEKHASLSLEDKLALPFVFMQMKGWQEKKTVIKMALEESGVYVNKIATVDNVLCLFELMKELNCATLLPAIKHLNRSGYTMCVLPDELQMTQPPAIVAYHKLSNQGNPLHELLIRKLKYYLFD
ncbi:LysR family transcriptional regulator [Vibrio coralliilyticus]|uniref:LysR family transcriptional regulator n=1 Tax=Vibrio coralliilyticus TaxID=190893 RepID=UPI00156159E0|nr:LysR family transcriptional regulator [Vibrio coralliilyticus]NRF25139.1 LysR family transcriptional regulator [Vibrio coralliilyticus]NRF79361.1 LysR family transcriptional regulator [Vibrio coralliilyticus]